MLDGFPLRRESLSLDELDLRLRFGGDFRDRFLRLRSEDDELLLDRDRDLDRDLCRRLERFELIDLLPPPPQLLPPFFFRLPNSSYSESEDSLALYSTTSRSL